MIDSHCHIHYIKDEDIDGVLDRMKALSQIMVIVDAAGNNPGEIIKKIQSLRKKTNTEILIAVGCHPLSVEKITLQELSARLSALLPQVDCIGEIGLDFSRENHQKNKQIEALKLQCKHAELSGKSINIHARDCTMEELIDIIKNYKIGKILHCCTFGWEDVEKFVEIGGFVSFSGIVTFKKRADHIKEAAKRIPIHRILVETDAPYLSPEPKRGKTNEPHHVQYIYEYISKLRKIDFYALVDHVTRNFNIVLGRN
jgi:TatD DNase family protein